MAILTKIDSNVTGLRFAEEASLGVLPATPEWVPLEPNSYDAFGGEITTVSRNPINESRQRRKGVLTDLDASGGINSDLTQNNLQELLQGFFFADLRRKSDVGLNRSPKRVTNLGDTEDYLITDIDGSMEDITVDSRVAVSAVVVVGGTTGYLVDDIIEVTDAGATVLARFRVSGATGGSVDTLDLVDPAVILGGVTPREGRTDTDTGVGTATVALTGSGDDLLTVTVTYDNGISWQVGDLVFTQGLDDAANNGKLRVTAVADNVITVAEDLVTDATPAASATMTTVGFQGAAGDIDVLQGDGAGLLPTLNSTLLDFTTLGLIPGEWLFIGGDAVLEAFTDVNNNGFARIKTIAATVLTLDKTTSTMVDEPSTSETVQLFFGRVIKNESTPALIRRRTYNMERTLGAPDDALPAAVQSEYLIGTVANQITFNFATADKITADLAFISTDNEQRTAATGLKSGTRPTLASEDAFNTSSDFTRLKMNVIDPLTGNPTALFAFLEDFTVVINNNVSPNKAISVLGAFELTAGQFNVEGSSTAYFSEVAAITAVRNNADVTLDFAVAKGPSGSKSGIVVDIPLISLGDARLNVEQDEPIKLPLTQPAAADPVLDHTLMMVFFDHLPDLADT